MSKKCTVCDGALGIEEKNRQQCEEIISNHTCQINYKGSASTCRTETFSYIKVFVFCETRSKRSVEVYRLKMWTLPPPPLSAQT
jgi:hypothetical protein